MILSQRQLEEIAASTTKDFNRFFFGDEADKPDRSALPTPIDQFAKNYLGLRVSFPKKHRLKSFVVEAAISSSWCWDKIMSSCPPVSYTHLQCSAMNIRLGIVAPTSFAISR